MKTFKFHSKAVFVLLLLLTVISCAKKEKKPSIGEDIAAINELYNQYCIHANAGDIDKFLSLWEDTAIRMDPDKPSIIGKENITKFFKPSFERFNVNVAVDDDKEIQILGNMAFSRGTYTLSITPKEGGSTTTFNGKWLDIDKRHADGSWKIYIDMVNYNGPPEVK
jgi:ketosteroid isomerase-like protein